MEFCQRCGAILTPDEKGKPVCPGCGYKPRKKIQIKSVEKIQSSQGVVVVNEKDSNTYPIVEIKCKNPKCKNKKAYFWTSQTRASDESETKFYKCTKCEHTWRVYR